MTFALQNLENHSGSGKGPKLWSYNGSADTLAGMHAAGYFNAAAFLLAVGDFIFARGSDGNGMLSVATNAAGVVGVGGAGGGALRGSATWDAGSIADGDEAVTEITVAGAALGDFVLASLSLDVADLNITAAVTAANTVTVQLNNNTGGAVDLAEATARVLVFK